MKIELIISYIRSGSVSITDHADEEAFNDNLKYEEICVSVIQGEIIEYYLNDKPYPSCLIFGKNLSGEPIHSVWAYNQEDLWAILVTVYRPDPALWVNWKERTKQ